MLVLYLSTREWSSWMFYSESQVTFQKAAQPDIPMPKFVIDRSALTTNEIPRLQTFHFWIVFFHLRRNVGFVSLNSGMVLECFILRARWLSRKLLNQIYLCLNSSFRKFEGRYGNLIHQYEVSLSRMLNDILTSMNYSEIPTNQILREFQDFDTEVDLHRMTSSFNRYFATDVECQQGTPTLLDTWFRPFLELALLQLLRPAFPTLWCLFSTFHIEYPSVLSQFCSKQYSI